MYLYFQVLSKTLDVKLAPEKGEIVTSSLIFANCKLVYAKRYVDGMLNW